MKVKFNDSIWASVYQAKPTGTTAALEGHAPAVAAGHAELPFVWCRPGGLPALDEHG